MPEEKLREEKVETTSPLTSDSEETERVITADQQPRAPTKPQWNISPHEIYIPQLLPDEPIEDCEEEEEEEILVTNKDQVDSLESATDLVETASNTPEKYEENEFKFKEVPSVIIPTSMISAQTLTRPEIINLSRIGAKLIGESEIKNDLVEILKRGIDLDKEIPEGFQKVPFNVPKNEKKILILDLDNTLIQYGENEYMKSKKKNSDKSKKSKTEIIYTEKNIHPFHLRPNSIEFLIKMKNIYNIVLFTAAEKSYAHSVLKKLEELAGERIFYCFYSRAHLQISYKTLLVKSIPQGVIESQIVIVDDSLLPWYHYRDNYIPIKAFKGMADDRQLGVLGEYLEVLGGVEDVRETNRACIRFWD